ncbi:MAG: DUF2797 domain-containing protein [Pseudomonadales bacterium]|nr:DUF2797 domain-containing protein [Pseudomonadales bacterium]
MPGFSGGLRKMRVAIDDADAAVAQYTLVLGEHELPLNELVGKPFTLNYEGAIHCIHCNRKTSKSFNQGYCYPCFRSLAQCDQCIVSPEKCHYHLGTCREPEWADKFCMQDHYVYLANSSGLKVGITRGNQIPTRWIDQGAVQALPLFRVTSRRMAGMVETLCKAHVADKTNWRAMLKGVPEPVDLQGEARTLLGSIKHELAELHKEFGIQAITELDSAEPVNIAYPVLAYPAKVTSHNFDKNPQVAGQLQGIKAQYLIFDTGVINLRKFGGYQVSAEFG